MPKNLEKYPFREAVLSDANGDLAKKWYINYYAWSQQQGKLVRKRVTINHPTAKERYAQAKIIIEAINTELRAGAIVEPIPIVEPEIRPTMELRKAVDFFLQSKSATVGRNTMKTYKKDLKVFLSWLELEQIDKIPLVDFDLQDAWAFSDFLDQKRIAKKTYSNFIGTLRGMWAHLIERQIIDENPFLKIPKRKGGRSQHIPYQPWQVREFKRICLHVEQDEQLWLFVNFIYYCFLRPGAEARNLQIRHIKKKTIIVPGDLAKNNETEHVRIPAGLEALIEEYKLRSYPPGYYIFSTDGKPGPEPVNERYFYAHNRKILVKAGFTDQEYDLYGWKHTGVISLYLATKDIKLVQVQCRHKDISTTDIYLRDLGLFLDQDALDIFPDPSKDHG
ncbi:tyrosine-type recombinase/integrase [Salmonirosea aquatica]|uniref:Tyrosine-type recombinase/integrase n=1 Tax=Salmonirosea aquatica TaxID=2654236 RepID=A0A7C9FBN0_9BACT|nr:tyrosine-type recombinase/integrase [Cytophagaceae bacterium SJW1-29]